jgi:hypothetical protein
MLGVKLRAAVRPLEAESFGDYTSGEVRVWETVSGWRQIRVPNQGATTCSGNGTRRYRLRRSSDYAFLVLRFALAHGLGADKPPALHQARQLLDRRTLKHVYDRQFRAELGRNPCCQLHGMQ